MLWPSIFRLVLILRHDADARAPQHAASLLVADRDYLLWLPPAHLAADCGKLSDLEPYAGPVPYYQDVMTTVGNELLTCEEDAVVEEGFHARG
jgi:hypothetical protein